jgi:hypothetical protein
MTYKRRDHVVFHGCINGWHQRQACDNPPRIAQLGPTLTTLGFLNRGLLKSQAAIRARNPDFAQKKVVSPLGAPKCRAKCLDCVSLVQMTQKEI